MAISAVANDLTSVKRIALFAADAAPFNGEPHLVTDILKGPSDATACGEKMDEISELAMVSK